MTQKRTKEPKVSTSEPQKLTLDTLNTLDFELDSTKAITITVKRKKFTVNINSHFRDSKLEVMAAKYVGFAQQLRMNTDATEETIIGTFKLFPTLVLMQFSDLPIDYEIKDLTDIIHIQKQLGDLGILHQVYNAFDEKELEKAKQFIERTAKDVGQLMGDKAVQEAFKELEANGNNEPETVGSST